MKTVGQLMYMSVCVKVCRFYDQHHSPNAKHMASAHLGRLLSTRYEESQGFKLLIMVTWVLCMVRFKATNGVDRECSRLANQGVLERR